ncbi:MAG TPA: hypothetical protein VKZ18_18430 [Polyangia bacterium]|nr:hypothetical protein [Polyangia bacterium]
MKRFASTLGGTAALLAATALLGTGCKSTTMGAAPTTFGVNITVDASALSSAQLAAVTVGSLIVVSDTEPRVKSLSVAPQIKSGKLTFQYIPNITSGTLTFEFEALDDARNLLGSGTSDGVTLKANAAVDATIKLTAASGTTKGLGTACTAGSTCNSGFCTDGVCCQDACKDTCANCALTDTKGLCAGYDAGIDPEGECAGSSMTTGSGGKGGAGGAGGAAGAGPDGGAPKDAGAGDAEVINPPDGGIVAMPAKCGGTCNGMKACASFANAGTSCGSSFCNTRKDVASPICDGKGTCAIGLADCTGGYACNDGAKPTACRTTCSANIDCLSGYYCNGSTNACAPTKVDGITCATDAECNSNHCASGVCCNTACDAPNSCNNSGSAGKCQCPGVTCAAGVACQIFYADSDVDGYGDRNGTITAGTAKAGCAGSPPAGFVADNTDCDDKDANVHPGQTAYFGTVSKGTGTFDYDCDGTIEKATGEYPNSSCTFCPSCSAGCGTGASTCATSGTQASLACPLEGGICLTTLQPTQAEVLMSVLPDAVTVVGPPIIIRTACCGCNDHAGFNATVACGQSGTFVTCGTCAAASAGVSGTTSGSKQQTCR